LLAADLPTKNMERWLIVNADDLGLSEGVNDGILRAHREGIVTCASLMVRWPAAVDAIERAGDLDLGLHLDLAEWACHDGDWAPVYQRVQLDEPEAVKAESYAQLQEFQRLTGRPPSHIDSHQHIHMQEPVLSVAKQMAIELGVPLRSCCDIRYRGDFYGQSGRGDPHPQAISVNSLVELLIGLRDETTELGCHPGEDASLDSTYARERFLEVQVLCHPEIRETLDRQNIRLARFVDLL
jgi:predicted glycoside hydrolase/deacetylase ChbG (UPF0249 family)